MANLTSVTYASGTLSSTVAGDVSTIDNLISSLTDGSAHVIVDSVVGVAQAAATSGKTGSMVMGAVNKGAVSYTDAQLNPLVLGPNGSLYTIGGSIGVITRDNVVLDSDGAQTDAALVSVSSGTRIVLTQISAVCSSANTTNIAVRVGFGTANVPTAALAGTAGIVINGTFGAGGGQQKGNGSGIIAVGADGEDLRLTCGDPVSGALYVTYSYYTVAA